MKIGLDRVKGEFYLHFEEDVIFTANPHHLTVLLSKEELDQLVAFGNAELQDSDETV